MISGNGLKRTAVKTPPEAGPTVDGYFLIPRGLMDRPVFRKGPFTEAQAFVWLIEHAAFQSRQVEIDGRVFDLDRGQLAASVRYLAAAWGWSKSKVERYTKKLKTKTLIETQAGTGPSVITVCNYDDIQNGLATIGTPNGTASGTRARQRVGQNKNKENNQGNQGTEENLSATNDAFEKWWARVPLKVGKGQARKAYKAALKKASADELLAGIVRYAAERADQPSKYTAHPATWLNGERWNDEPAAPRDDDGRLAAVRRYLERNGGQDGSAH